MHKLKLAFGVKDRRYGKKLSDYLTVHPKETCAVTVFSEPERLSKEKEDFDIILAEEEFLAAGKKEEKAPLQILLHNGTASLEVKEYPGIFLYQSVDEILREVLSLIGNLVPKDSLYLSGKRILAVYSPEGAEDQMLFSLELAKKLASKGELLYVNFCDFAGLSEHLGREFGKDLSELLYYSRLEEERFYGRLSSVIEKYEGFDLIPPASNPENLHELTAEEYRSFFTKLCERTPYQTILIDFGFVLPGFRDLLSRCEAVLLPEGNSPLSEHRKQAFLMWFGEEKEKLFPVRLNGDWDFLSSME